MLRWPAILLLLLLLALSGCGLFSTRPAESPGAGRHTYMPARFLKDVLDNIHFALLEGDAYNYMLSFDSTAFRFEADPSVLSQDAYLDPWGYDKESSHVRNLFLQGSLTNDEHVSVIFTSPDSDMTNPESPTLNVGYDLTAKVANSVRQMAGTAYFTLHRGADGYWHIQDWRDIRSRDASTWSVLKSLVH